VVGGPNNTVCIIPYNGDVMDSGITRYVENFSSQTTVVATHNLGMEPVVQAFNLSGVVLTGITSITHDSPNQTTVIFGSAKSGSLVCIAGSDLNRPLDVNHVGVTKMGDGGVTDYVEVDAQGRAEYHGAAAPVLERYTCTTTEAVGNAVYISASGNVRQANASDKTKSPAIGFVVFKIDDTTCLVQRTGTLRGFGGLVPADPSIGEKGLVFLDTSNGGITQDAPDNVYNCVQILGVAKSATEIELEIDVDGFYIVAASQNRAVRWNPYTKEAELAPTAFSGISGSLVSYLDTFNTSSDSHLLGAPGAPHLEPQGLGFILKRLSVGFRTTSPSNCKVGVRAYIRRLVSGVWQSDEVLRLTWMSDDIGAGARFNLATIVDRSGRGLAVNAHPVAASVVSNARDAGNENTRTLQATGDRIYQVFKTPTTSPCLLTKVVLRCGYTGSLTNAALKCHIAALASNGTGDRPKNSVTNTYRTLDVGSAQVAASAMVGAGGDVEFDFLGNRAYLDADTSYALVVEPVASGETLDASNNFQVFQTTDSAYANGGSGSSADSGATWTAPSSTDDLRFEIHGQAAEGIRISVLAADTDKIDQLNVRLDTELV